MAVRLPLRAGGAGRARADAPRLLEVAIGTGYPVADFLARAGYRVHGVDISPALVARCRELNPAIDAVVGDAERLDHPDRSFDATYCFHSSWYFPDLRRALAEMIRVTRPGGLVMIDIQNASHREIKAAYQGRRDQLRPGLLPRAELHARNLAKVILRRGNPNWQAVNYEVPTDPAAVGEELAAHRMTDVTVLARDEADQSVHPLDATAALDESPRLIFAARVPERGSSRLPGQAPTAQG